MTTQFSPKRLDVHRFAHDGGTLEGEGRLADFERLLAEAEGREPDSTVAWSATGELREPGHVQPQVWIHLRADAVLPLTCQRCLGPVATEVEVDRSFRFVTDEETAAAQDDEAEEDVLALSRAFDLVTLVEDELLMALPLSPRHETCPEQLPMAVEDEDFEGSSARHENPFSVLGQLKARKPQ